MKQIIILGFIILASCKEKHLSTVQSRDNKKQVLVWTETMAKQYNRDQFDETKWDLEILENELSYIDMDPWPTQPPMEKQVYPVAKYGPGYEGYSSKSISIEINDKIIKGGAFAVSTNQNTIEPEHDSERSNYIFFNILILTDKPDSEDSSLSVSSRNYPHHTCQGRRKTSKGNIDWIAMHLASGEKFALVSTKYFNLKFGQTILVAPQQDGSIRFKQVNLPPLSTKEIDNEIVKLGARNDVIEFFTKSTNI